MARHKAGSTDVALGVRTRAKTLALNKNLPEPENNNSYLQLRSRRLPKTIRGTEKKVKKKVNKRNYPNAPVVDQNKNKGCQLADIQIVNAPHFVCAEQQEGCFGDNFGDSQPKDRSTRESTPISLVRDPEIIRTPGSSTRPTRSGQAHIQTHNPMLRHIPSAHDMDEFFAGGEVLQQQQFIEKYNFDPVNDKPLPGRYKWVKLEPKS